MDEPREPFSQPGDEAAVSESGPISHPAMPLESPADILPAADVAPAADPVATEPPEVVDPAALLAIKLLRCEDRIGYIFNDKSLLRAALTHASGAEHRLASNERLEFLGDAILGAVVCDVLYRRYPSFLEGELTRIKSVVVSRHTCAKISALLGLEEFLIMGKGMASNPSVPQSLLADVFESLLAAMYLDSDNGTAAHDFVKKYVGPEIILAVSGQIGDNYKSQLQQLAQREHATTPIYHLADEKGPDHSKCFKVLARLGSREFSPAWGRNKKEAEQRAACNALAELAGADPPFPSD